MENFNLTSAILLGFLIIWSLIYWIVPSVVVRLRAPRKRSEHNSRFLSETGTIHRLGRDTDRDSR
ncbi:MAG: hypothetical protein ABIW48_05790 [Burkholderiales bacterium]